MNDFDPMKQIEIEKIYRKMPLELIPWNIETPPEALLASYTGLRPSTIQRLTVRQFKAALDEERPVLHVLAEQEKNRIEHYVPLHPFVVSTISEVLVHDFSEKDDAEPFFMFHSFESA